MISWDKAYENTTKVPFGIGNKIACKKCNEITNTTSTEQRQIIGNCYQVIVECEKCENHFIDE